MPPLFVYWHFVECGLYLNLKTSRYCEYPKVYVFWYMKSNYMVKHNLRSSQLIFSLKYMQLERFDSNGLELVINTQDGSVYASQSAIGRMCEKGENTIRSFASSHNLRALRVEIPTEQGIRIAKVYAESELLSIFERFKPNLINSYIRFVKSNTTRDVELPEFQERGKRAHKQKLISYIYLIQPSNLPIVKIGLSVNPKKRLKTLQTSHYEELKLIAIKEGTRYEELKLHTKFQELHVRGEWFKLTYDIKLEFDLPLGLNDSSFSKNLY